MINVLYTNEINNAIDDAVSGCFGAIVKTIGFGIGTFGLVFYTARFVYKFRVNKSISF